MQSNRTEPFTMRMFLFFVIGVLAAARALAADPQIPIVGKLLRTLIGYTAQPAGIQIIFYLGTLLIISGLMRLFSPAAPASPRQGGDPFRPVSPQAA
jgi:hypothetical protein